MAYLWHQERDGTWAYQELTTTCVDLGRSTAGAEPDSSPTPAPIIVERESCWVLLAGYPGAARQDVSVNGEPVARLRILDHRDEIKVGDAERRYFTTEKPARIVPFETPTDDRQVKCARCRSTIERSDAVVTCPGCGAIHHQSDDRPCWTYESRCASCRDQATTLDAGFRWTPEGL